MLFETPGKATMVSHSDDWNWIVMHCADETHRLWDRQENIKNPARWRYAGSHNDALFAMWSLDNLLRLVLT